MDADIVRLVVICVVAGLLWWANSSLNEVPKLNKIVGVAIIVIAVLMCIRPILNLLNGI